MHNYNQQMNDLSGANRLCSWTASHNIYTNFHQANKSKLRIWTLFFTFKLTDKTQCTFAAGSLRNFDWKCCNVCIPIIQLYTTVNRTYDPLKLQLALCQKNEGCCWRVVDGITTNHAELFDRCILIYFEFKIFTGCGIFISRIYCLTSYL